MIERLYAFTQSDTKIIEKIIEDDYAAINHMVLAKSDALPEHYSNSNVYLIVVRGTITTGFDEQEKHFYTAGTILTIPYQTKMSISNQDDPVAELFVVKAPSPRIINKK